jgi:uncharacterized membrane protein SpoIIM required for sporulation
MDKGAIMDIYKFLIFCLLLLCAGFIAGFFLAWYLIGYEKSQSNDGPEQPK